jgi:hypothetical protein
VRVASFEKWDLDQNCLREYVAASSDCSIHNPVNEIHCVWTTQLAASASSLCATYPGEFLRQLNTSRIQPSDRGRRPWRPRRWHYNFIRSALVAVTRLPNSHAKNYRRKHLAAAPEKNCSKYWWSWCAAATAKKSTPSPLGKPSTADAFHLRREQMWCFGGRAGRRVVSSRQRKR